MPQYKVMLLVPTEHIISAPTPGAANLYAKHRHNENSVFLDRDNGEGAVRLEAMTLSTTKCATDEDNPVVDDPGGAA